MQTPVARPRWIRLRLGSASVARPRWIRLRLGSASAAAADDEVHPGALRTPDSRPRALRQDSTACPPRVDAAHSPDSAPGPNDQPARGGQPRADDSRHVADRGRRRGRWGRLWRRRRWWRGRRWRWGGRRRRGRRRRRRRRRRAAYADGRGHEGVRRAVVRERPGIVEGEREGFTVLQLNRIERPGIRGDCVPDLTLVRPANCGAGRDIDGARLEIEIDDVHRSRAGSTGRV
jgi:hypothetical protein